MSQHRKVTTQRGIGNCGRWLFLALLTGLVATDVCKAAHPFHATLAEIEWNATSQRFEVSLQLVGVEIEDELSALQGRRINLETMPEAEKLLEDYVRQHFRISDARHTGCRMHWVGMDVENRNVWAYFEAELLADPTTNVADDAHGESTKLNVAEQKTEEASTATSSSGNTAGGNKTDDSKSDGNVELDEFGELKVRCTILTESRPNQVNLVNCRIAQKTGSVHLTAEQPEAPLEFRKTSLRSPFRPADSAK